MSTAPIPKYTAKDLLGPEFEDGQFELIEGELVEMSPNQDTHLAVLIRLNEILMFQLAMIPEKRGKVGIGSPEAGLLVSKNPDSVLAPDMVVIDRRTGLAERGRFIDVPPAMVVEILPPSNRATQTINKVSLYLEFGVREVWVICPKRREIAVHSAEADLPRIYGVDDIIDCPVPLEGVRVPVRKVFED